MELRKIADKIKTDKKNLNLLLDLNEKLESGEFDRVEGIKIAVELWEYLIENRLYVDHDNDDDDDEVVVKDDRVLDEWMRKRFDFLWRFLLENSDKDAVFVAGCFRLIKSLHSVKIIGDGHHWRGNSVKKLRNFLQRILLSEKNEEKLVKRYMKNYFDFEDVKQQIIFGLAKIVKKCRKTANKNNLLAILEMIELKRRDEIDEGGGHNFLCDDFDYETVKKPFSEVWEYFLNLKHDLIAYKRILLIFNDRVLPHLTRPLLMTDFLISSYNLGNGSLSVLALSGVFTLMQEFNLEYPDFYHKLYALFTRQNMEAKYRARLLFNADVFLLSSHLPEYLVAAFVKRMARLCLTLSQPAILSLIPFVANLIWRHKNLAKMINGQNRSDEDPFIEDETDLAKCGAIDSSLWEIKTLNSHISPQVVNAVRQFEKKVGKEEFPMDELAWNDLMEVECKKKAFVNVPLTFERPAKMPRNDFIADTFCAE